MTFNPQARRYDTDNLFDDDGVGTNNEWVDLQPLGTEGQFSVGSLSEISLFLRSLALRVYFWAYHPADTG